MIPFAAIAAGLGGAVGLFGGANSTGNYDPSERALKRFYELTDPNSGHYKQLRAMYGKYFADSSMTPDSLLGLARSGGSSAQSASSLAYRQGQAQTNKNREGIFNQVQRSYLESEQAAQGYLGLDYNMRANSQESKASFFDQVLGLSGGLLGKLIPGTLPTGTNVQEAYPNG